MTDDIPFLRKLEAEFSDLTARDEAPSLAARRQWRRPLLVFALPTVAVIVLALMALVPSEQSTGLSDAYAATAPDGKILHAVQNVTVVSHGKSAVEQSVETFWDGTNLRTLTKKDGRLISESISDNDNVATYLPMPNTIRQSPLSLLSGERYKDPVERFRELYRAGKLHAAGTETVNGKTMTKAAMRDGDELRTWLFDSDTQTPVRFSTLVGDPSSPSYAYTAEYLSYERLPRDAANQQELSMSAHPGATRSEGAVRPTDFE